MNSRQRKTGFSIFLILYADFNMMKHRGVGLMKQKVRLSPSMKLSQFDNGYWYGTELKHFAKSIGIPFANRLRKDELEQCIKLFLKTGKTESSERLNSAMSGTKDVDLGLSLDLRVAVYTN